MSWVPGELAYPDLAGTQCVLHWECFKALLPETPSQMPLCTPMAQGKDKEGWQFQQEEADVLLSCLFMNVYEAPTACLACTRHE